MLFRFNLYRKKKGGVVSAEQGRGWRTGWGSVTLQYVEVELAQAARFS